MSQFEGFAELEREGWTSEKGASGYVELFSSASDMAIPAILDKLEPFSHVLDLCCGQGNVTEALIAQGHEVVGIDFSPEMLTIARRRAPEAEFIEADAQELPFEDDRFDCVVCNFGIMHIPDQMGALAEIHRVLRPEGQLAMTTWSGPDLSPAFKILYGSVKAFGDPAVRLPDAPDFHQFADRDTARRILRHAHFRMTAHAPVACSFSLSSPGALVDIFQEGTPRAGYLLTQQNEPNRAAIRKSITDCVEARYRNGSGWQVPIPAVVVSSTAIE